MALAAGSNLGPYRIIEPVGRGGMASVFKAYEPSLDRYVALKVLPPEFLHDPSFAERFRREAQTVARLEHPQIIPIFAYDIDAETGTPWMAMRLISGGSLSQRIKHGRLAPSESARILKDVAEALDYAHGAGVIHRDVKPQNVLLDDAGRVYLADFGIAKMVESTAHMTQTGMITGTPQYMAPEQALGKKIDKSIDIYALGIVAYELFTGRVPFSADTPVAVLMKQASEPMPLPPVSEVKEDVTRAILRATAKDPAARWASASAFAQAVTSATMSGASTAALEPTGVMPALGQETVISPAASRTVAAATKVLPPKAQAGRRVQGSGLGLAAVILASLGLLGAAAVYLAYRYLQPGTTAVTDAAVAISPTPFSTPTGTPAPTSIPAPTAAVESTTPDTPAAAPEEEAAVEAPARRLTPAERRALIRDPAARRERLEAIAEARGRRTGRATGTGEATPSGETAAPPAPAVRAARARINLEVEASQPSTGTQISALFAQVTIDGRVFREFVIRFTGANSFARWKKVENIVLENVPLNSREITLAVGTDASISQDRIEDSTQLSLEGEETNLSVAVRFYNQFDKSVRFR
jgi:predicted Ser/Thr protein kinase